MSRFGFVFPYKEENEDLFMYFSLSFFQNRDSESETVIMALGPLGGGLGGINILQNISLWYLFFDGYW